MRKSKPYKLAVGAVVLDNSCRCLLVRRSAQCGNFVGQWEWPGGKVTDGEYFTTALRREVGEETSLEVEITGLAGATVFELPAIHVVLLIMETRVRSGQLKLSEEHDQFAWVPLAELPQWSLVGPVRHLMLEYAKQKEEKP